MTYLNVNVLGVSVGVGTTSSTATSPTSPTSTTTTPSSTATPPNSTTSANSSTNKSAASSVTTQGAIAPRQSFKPSAESKVGVTILNLIQTPQEVVAIVASASFDPSVQPESWSPKQLSIPELMKQYPVRI